jgi:hypothetical protein
MGCGPTVVLSGGVKGSAVVVMQSLKAVDRAGDLGANDDGGSCWTACCLNVLGVQRARTGG